MTQKEFCEAVVSTSTDKEVVDFARNEIAKIDARNSKRAGTTTKTQEANELLKEKILAWITVCDEIVIASAVGEAMEISTQKASALLVQLTKSGSLTVADVKVSKKGKMKGYSLNKESVENEHDICLAESQNAQLAHDGF